MKTENHSRATPEKTLVLKEVIDRYPRMLELLHEAEKELNHFAPDVFAHEFSIAKALCVKCQIQKLLTEVGK